MSETESRNSDSFAESDPRSARIETQGGTVYWISEAGDDDVRWIIREHLRTSDTNTMVMQSSTSSGSIDLGDKFRAIVRSEVKVGSSFILDVVEKDTRLVSEPVVDIETGNVPSMLFG